MGRYMVEELKRYVAGKPLKWTVTPETAQNSSHRPVLSINRALNRKRAAALSTAPGRS